MNARILIYAAVFMISAVWNIGTADITHAQQRTQRPATQQTAPAPPAPAPEAPPPPYEPQMLRLATIMGAMSFLEDLCRLSDGASWRGKMQALIDAEEASPARRERLAGAYNRGFTGYQDIYRTCTPSARAAMERFVQEGAGLTSEISNRFGG